MNNHPNNPHSPTASRPKVASLLAIPNVGKATVADLKLLGIERPEQLCGQNPLTMYFELCAITQQRHDPCALDVFMAIVAYMEDGKKLPWWTFTTQRKAQYKAAIDAHFLM